MPLWSGRADKTKKAYELIYDDVQVLKQQVQDIADRLERNAEEIRLVRQQLDALGRVPSGGRRPDQSGPEGGPQGRPRSNTRPWPAGSSS